MPLTGIHQDITKTKLLIEQLQLEPERNCSSNKHKRDHYRRHCPIQHVALIRPRVDQLEVKIARRVPAHLIALPTVEYKALKLIHDDQFRRVFRHRHVGKRAKERRHRFDAPQKSAAEHRQDRDRERSHAVCQIHIEKETKLAQKKV